MKLTLVKEKFAGTFFGYYNYIFTCLNGQTTLLIKNRVYIRCMILFALFLD